MNHPKEIYVHCTATPEGRPVSVADIRKWHTSPPLNWSDIGYHRVVDLSGIAHNGRDLDRDGDVEEHVGAHAYGHNRGSLGIVYVGGIDAVTFKPKDTRTPEQRETLFQEVLGWMRKYGIPPEKVKGHYEVEPKKACPSFPMEPFRAELRARLGQTKPSHYDGAYPLVRYGSSGFDVLVLQNFLRRLVPGYAEDSGVFTSATGGAVIQFQQEHSLVPDGVVGKVTWRALLQSV